jgi:hypothetical protein
MTDKMKSQIEELEDLARRFIIGYAPLTEAQRGFLIDIRQLEEQREHHKRILDRYDRIIEVLYQKLADSPMKEK